MVAVLKVLIYDRSQSVGHRRSPPPRVCLLSVWREGGVKGREQSVEFIFVYSRGGEGGRGRGRGAREC